MHQILSDYLNKQGIKDVTKMSSEEKETFDNWQKVLSEEELTLAKVAEFCYNQTKLIEAQWKNLDNSVDKNQRLIILHTVYSTINQLISGPKVERENLIKYLNGLLQ